MNVQAMTPNQIRHAGIRALCKSLGPIGAVRFMQQFQQGQGDYTAGRPRLLGDPTLDELLGEVARTRSSAKARRPVKR